MAANVQRSSRSNAQKNPVRPFVGRAWANGVLFRAGASTARELAELLQPKTYPDDAIEDVERQWLRHLAGRVPKEQMADGRDGLARRIDRRFHGTLEALSFPIWSALQAKVMDFTQLQKIAQACVPSVRQFYFDGLEQKSEYEKRCQLFRAICVPIEIDRHDPRVAVDHLAVQIAIARLDWLRYSGSQVFVSRNILETLEDVALSEWFVVFYEEFFDFLEKTVWHQVFLESPSCRLHRGWRQVAGSSIATALKDRESRR